MGKKYKYILGSTFVGFRKYPKSFVQIGDPVLMTYH